jgi:hypothetical protein
MGKGGLDVLDAPHADSKIRADSSGGCRICVIFFSVLLDAFWIDMAIGGFGLVIAAAMGVIGFALFYRGWTVDDH